METKSSETKSAKIFQSGIEKRPSTERKIICISTFLYLHKAIYSHFNIGTLLISSEEFANSKKKLEAPISSFFKLKKYFRPIYHFATYIELSQKFITDVF